MKFIEFKNSLNNEGEKPSIYLFEGEDAYFRARGLALLKEKYVSEPSLNYCEYEGSVDSDSLIQSLSVCPVMSEKRLTCVKEFYPKTEFIKLGLKDFLDNPSNDSLLVILNENSTDTLKKFKNVELVECKKADASILIKWIKSTCERDGVSVDMEVARSIVTYTLSDMSRIENEVNKLISFVGKDGIITQETVEQLVTKDVETIIYKLTEYISRKKFNLALSVITDMLSKGDSPQMILSAIYKYFRKLLHTAISGKSVSELCSAFSISEYPAQKLKEQAGLFKAKSLKNAVDYLIEADYNLKSGKGDVDDIMWLTVFKLMIN